jgi:transposase
MSSPFNALPCDLTAAHAMIVAERDAGEKAEAVAAAAKAEAINARAQAAHAQADLSSHEALVAHLKLEIEKLRRQLYGRRSERRDRLLDRSSCSWRNLSGSDRMS